MPTSSNPSGSPAHDTPDIPAPGADGVTQFAGLDGLIDFAIAALNLPVPAGSPLAAGDAPGPGAEYTEIAGQMQALTDLWQRDTGLSAAGMAFHGDALDLLLANAGLSSEAPTATRDGSHTPLEHDLAASPGSAGVFQIPVHPAHDWSN